MSVDMLITVVAPASSLPAADVVLVVLAVLLSAVVCFAGARILRTAFALLGLLTGGMIGWTIAAGLDLGQTPDWAVAIAAGLVFALIASLAYRLAVSLVFSLLLATGGGALMLAAADQGWFDPGPERVMVTEEDGPRGGFVQGGPDDGSVEVDPTAGLPPELAEALKPILEQQAAGTPLDRMAERAKDLPDQMGMSDAQRERAREVGQVLTSGAKAAWGRWTGAPHKLRLAILAAGLLGALIGLIVSSFSPHVSAVFVTSAAGGAAMLAGGMVLAASFAVPIGDFGPVTPLRWLVWNAGLVLVGAAIQFKFRKRTTDSPE